ncbi:transferase family-domain-containing protein [Macrophomina phaseolina]|uniref:Transferase family-domain-containing protein n=1 Tax=Macrophomina phaseolina TaxID=35725 RepID=A0ABQ8GW92_9PEZI|nr:transferase family-domain-containing protein [Macrophomina phaseolina]
MFGHTNDALIFSPVENAGPRVYARNILCFALGPDYDAEEITGILKGGLEATKQQIPYLSAEVVLDTDNTKQKGCLCLQEGAFGELRAKQLSKSEFGLTYDEFKARNYPVAELREEAVHPVPLLPRAGEAVPVLAAQANFVEGGLLLSFCIFHLVADGFSCARVFQMWAQNCRRLQDPAARESVFLSSSAFERAPLTVGHLSDPDKCDPADFPEFKVTAEPEEQCPSLHRPYRAQVWRFSPAALARLRADCAGDDGRKASTDDALAALIWRCTIAAQLGPDDVARLAEPLSILSVTVEARQRIFPPLAPDYMGCPYIYAMSRVPVADLVAGTAELPALAALTRRATAAITPHYLSSVINIFQKVPDYACLKPTCFDDLGGQHVFHSSWDNLPWYEAEWGPKLGGTAERFRVSSGGMMNGLQLVLPRVPKGLGPDGSDGVEVLMAFEEGKEDRLKADPLWNRYAVPA